MTDDLISRQAAIDEAYDVMIDGEIFRVVQVETLYGLPSAESEPFMIAMIESPDIERLKEIVNNPSYMTIFPLPKAQPEVISCLDCIHYTPLGIDKSWGRCAIHSSPTENQRMCQSCDFCSWAERKADE